MNKFFSLRSVYQQILSGSVIVGILFSTTPVPLFYTVAHAAEPAGTLSVVMQVVNSHGGMNVPADFIVNITGAGATPSFFLGSSTAQLVSVPTDTNFNVLVNGGSRYTSMFSLGCSGVIVASVLSVCEITLSDTILFPTDTIAPNLIPNSNLEIVDPSDTTEPLAWSKGWPWGTNVATYTYPVSPTAASPISSGSAVGISYASYTGSVLTGGDAKWYFAPVAVTPGSRYLYQDAYSANTETFIVAEFFNATNQHLANAGYYSAPSTGLDTWKMSSVTFIAPPGAAYMSVYHQLNSEGTLNIDNVSLGETALPKAFDRGFVSLAFDDGYISHFTNAKPLLNSAGVKGTFYAVSHTSGLGIVNPSLESPDTVDATKPLGWFSSGGTDSIYSYPVSGRTGNAVRFSSPNPESGSGWNFAPVTVFANQNHQFSNYYKSTTESTVFIEVAKNDGTLAYMQSDGGLVSTRVAYAVLPPAFDWTLFESGGLWIPPGSESVSVRYGLVASGTLDVDDANLGAYLDFMTPNQLLTLQGEQHEIGGHTETHANLTAIPFAEALKEMNGSRTDLLAGGFSPVLSFAYPLGENNENIQNVIASAGYTSGRGTIPGHNGKDANKYTLASVMVKSDTSIEEVEGLVNTALADRSWLILTFHHILPIGSPSATAYTTTPERLESIISYLGKNNVPVRTVASGVAQMDGGLPIPPPPTPTPTPSPTPTPTPTPTPAASGGGGGGSASFEYWGCTEPTAENYNRLANRNQGCVFATDEVNTLSTSTEVSVVPTITGSEQMGNNNSGEVLGTTTETMPRHSFKVHLRKGLRGKDVTELQRRLTESGHFSGPITGYFGDMTLAGVKKFQLMHKIDAIGLVGPKTRAALNKERDSYVVSSTNAGITFERI